MISNFFLWQRSQLPLKTDLNKTHPLDSWYQQSNNFNAYKRFSPVLCYRPTAEKQGRGEQLLLRIMLYSVNSTMGTSTST
jgi:hypothetical protein